MDSTIDDKAQKKMTKHRMKQSAVKDRLSRSYCVYTNNPSLNDQKHFKSTMHTNNTVQSNELNVDQVPNYIEYLNALLAEQIRCIFYGNYGIFLLFLPKHLCCPSTSLTRPF